MVTDYLTKVIVYWTSVVLDVHCICYFLRKKIPVVLICKICTSLV